MGEEAQYTPALADLRSSKLLPDTVQQVEAFLPLMLALLLFASSTAALCLVGFFHVSLSDLCDDLVNPITLCHRKLNPKVKVEGALYVLTALVWVLAWQPIGIALALPSLVLRFYWHHELHVDPTTIFKEAVQRALRWRWSVMCPMPTLRVLDPLPTSAVHPFTPGPNAPCRCAWHGVAVFIGFFQCAHAIHTWGGANCEKVCGGLKMDHGH